MVASLAAIYAAVVVFCIYALVGFVASLIAEAGHRKKSGRGSGWCTTYCESLGNNSEYYSSFVLRALDESTTIGFIIALYVLNQDCLTEGDTDCAFNTKTVSPPMYFALSLAVFAFYRVFSAVSVLFIDIFHSAQCVPQLLGLNSLYEIYLSHCNRQKNPVLEWMNKQYVYIVTLPMLFLQISFFISFPHIWSKQSASFTITIVSIIFGIFNAFVTIIRNDRLSFVDRCNQMTKQGFRLRSAYRVTEYFSRVIWFAFFWFFLGNIPFAILIAVLLAHSVYMYVRGFLRDDLFNIVTNLFIVPDLSAGMGLSHTSNYIEIYDWEKIAYSVVYFSCCVIGAMGIISNDLKAVDLVFWTHIFEDLCMWAFIVGYANQNPSDGCWQCPDRSIWKLLFDDELYLAFFCIGIIFWFFRVGYYLTLRAEDMFDKNRQPISVSSGVLGLASSGEWASLEKFMTRVSKAQINRTDGRGQTALHKALTASQWPIATKLLDAGADINLADRSDKTAMHILASHSNCRDEAIFKRCVDEFKNINTARDDNGRTLVHLTAQNKQTYIQMEKRFELLFAHVSKPDVNLVDSQGCTALHYAAEFNEPSPITALVDAGANIDARDNNQKTPLHRACEKSYLNTSIRTLLKLGSDANAQNQYGWTALHFAANRGSRDTVDILLEFFPDVTLKNNADKTAEQVARDRGYAQVADTLKMNSPNNDDKSGETNKGGDDAAPLPPGTLFIKPKLSESSEDSAAVAIKAVEAAVAGDKAKDTKLDGMSKENILASEEIKNNPKFANALFRLKVGVPISGLLIDMQRDDAITDADIDRFKSIAKGESKSEPKKDAVLSDTLQSAATVDPNATVDIIDSIVIEIAETKESETDSTTAEKQSNEPPPASSNVVLEVELEEKTLQSDATTDNVSNKSEPTDDAATTDETEAEKPADNDDDAEAKESEAGDGATKTEDDSTEEEPPLGVQSVESEEEPMDESKGLLAKTDTVAIEDVEKAADRLTGESQSDNAAFAE